MAIRPGIGKKRRKSCSGFLSSEPPRGMISYSDLVARIDSIHMEPDSFALAHMLGEVSEAENAAGRGMLSVIVVHKDGDMQPGLGFFELAKKLGRDTSDKTACWVEELRRVHRSWSNR